MSAYLTGHVLDGVDERDYRYADHPEIAGAPSPAPPKDTDLRDVCPPIRNQIAQDCCAHATADAIFVAVRLNGMSMFLASILWLYAIAQLIARPKQPLLDHGSGLREMFQGMRDVGIVLEKDWPEIAESVNVIPPDDLFRDAEKRVAVRYYAIADGARSAEEICAALERGRTPTVAFMVDEKFANIGPDVYDLPGGRILGSHAMLIVGYSAARDAFLVRNSWGTDFGDLGYAWVSARFVNLYSYGKWVLDAAPRVQEAA